MTMVDTTQLGEVIESFNASADAAIEGENAAGFAQLESQLGEVEGYVRELQQAMWVDEAAQALDRLEKDEPLTQADREVIRVFLVSDAVAYLNKENNYGQWISELKRLMGELSKSGRMADRNNIAELRGMLKDAIRLLPDIRNYLDEKSRVEHFDLAVDALEPKTRDMVVKIIREQLFSPAR